ncbi:MAG: hypothetical protein A2Y48_06570 [Nitrospirae bacterium RIFCSPLOW2_12_42_9]|nr:MAG: hypothetical protein A3D21_03870 [Nitrospirae bacterium RIFCSPHIGHO2_02_FULL_42_12]OGW57973.1 MAG: hypothetical protein A2Y48_06570 [Nitrospirae bacterium RIFCSPLOW2_12_42_9]HAS17573.1 hypothetical protein [Nitrospiraceae bacterium]
MTNHLPLNKEKLEKLLLLIEESLKSLERFKGIPIETFKEVKDNFKIVFFDLHQALEAIMDIGNHILSRIPGTRPERYKDIARLLGENSIVPSDFANGPLLNMAGYRNRMVHVYSEITVTELHGIIQNDLKDIETFIQHIKSLLTNPENFNLTISENE